MISQEAFLEKLSQIRNEEHAEHVLHLAYPTDNMSSDNFFHSSGIRDLSWESFYAVREIEEKYDLSCYVSAYLATTLAYPKISSYYAEMAANCHQEKSDFCSRVYLMTMCKLIPEWDKSKNDNFLAYMLPNLRTVRNEIFAEDNGPSQYLRKKKGLSTVSMDALKEKSETGWDTADKEQNTEEAALANIEMDKKRLLKRIVCLGSNKMATEENIWNSIVCQKLFHSQNEDELEILNDSSITSMLSLYFSAIDRGFIDGPKMPTEKEELFIEESLASC